MINIKKVISILLVLCTLLSVIPYSALALSWDGDSAGGSTDAVNGSSTGYVICSPVHLSGEKKVLTSTGK